MKGIYKFFVGTIFVLSTVGSLQAEPYIGAYGGYAFPMSLYHVYIAGTNLTPQTTTAPIPYKGNGYGGFTLGYYMDDYPWFGVAFYMDFTKQNQQRKKLAITTPPWGSIVGATIYQDCGTGSLWTIESDLIALARYPQPLCEPYLGLGVAILGSKRTLGEASAFGQTIQYNTSSNTVAPGLNFRFGLRFLKKYHYSPFVEYKLTWSQLVFFPNAGAEASGISGVKAGFLSNNIAGGFSYVF